MIQDPVPSRSTPSSGPRCRPAVDFETEITPRGLLVLVTTSATTPTPGIAPPADEPRSGLRAPADEAIAFDESAFQAFVRDQSDGRHVRDWAHALHVPRDVAADMTQDALLGLWRHRARIAAPRWAGWFHKAMLRCAYGYSRARRRAKKHEPAIAFELFERQETPSPEAQAYLRQCERELLRLIAQLRPERRDVVQLYLIEELPMKETAARLGIPEDTAKSRWRLAQADMGDAFRRERAKERFRALAAAFLAFLLSLWSRIRRGSKRVVPVVACAALVVLVAHDEASLHAATSEDVLVEMPSPRFEHVFATSQTGFAERELERAAPISASTHKPSSDVARMLLVKASAAVRDGRISVARTYLAQYKAAFPGHPDEGAARQYVAIVAEIAAR